MAEHLAQSARQRRVATLAIALACGAIAFTYAGGDDSPDVSPTGSPDPSVTTDASVLGVVITQPGGLPTAAPASPAAVDEIEDDGQDADPSPTTADDEDATTTRPPVSLVPPTFIENTTTTTEGTPPPTVDLTTTTSAPASTTTETSPG